jgi:Membrane bound O-acyl transferase family
MVGTFVYCELQALYDVVTIITILFFGYSPIDWPPIFNEPWKSTSLVDFWANRWHQIFRIPFINLGNRPLAYIFGRKSGVGLFGGFLMSCLLHTLGMWRMGETVDFMFVGGYFIVQGLGVFFEVKVLGGKVGGWKGWIWTMIWVVGWSNMLVHAWFLRGFAASAFVPDAFRPSMVASEFVRNLTF